MNIIDPQSFAKQMAESWGSSTYGYATPAHKAVWVQQAQVFNDKITGRTRNKWVILHPPTGVGKSEGLKLYCSMLPDDEHPGVLIVTRLKSDATSMADGINALSGKALAVAKHTGNDLSVDSIYDYPFDGCKKKELIHEITLGHQITCLVQAINRVQCRVCIDAEGNCAPTNVYIILPDKERAREVLLGIVREMPNIKLIKWKATAKRRKIKRSSYEDALIAFLSNKMPGKYKAKEVRMGIGIPPTTFERLQLKARDVGSVLYAQLKGIGVSLLLPDNGKGGRGHNSNFVKV